MKTYRVTIRATVTKTVTVEAENEDDATDAAHEDFSVLCGGEDEDERYEEETLSIEEDET
jgi:hypothetical protein